MDNYSHVWVYARERNFPSESVRQRNYLMARAQTWNYPVYGSSTDSAHYFCFRPGYREMIRNIRHGKVDCVLLLSFGAIGHSKHQILHFLRTVTRYGVKVKTASYDAQYTAHYHGFGSSVERYAQMCGCEFPWA